VEFSLREFNTGGFPKGLSLMLAVMPNWLYERGAPTNPNPNRNPNPIPNPNPKPEPETRTRTRTRTRTSTL
jgi:hypothetical protein